MIRVRIGTRRSALAQAQALWVAAQLRGQGVESELVLMTTSGDQHKGPITPDSSGGLKALFTKELEEALLGRRIDLAVHSLKDMTTVLPEGLVLGAVPPREDPRDAWISKDGTRFQNLPKGATVATGAVRRQAQLRHVRPDLRLNGLRGNVDTRLRKLQENGFHGIVLAAAGLKRLGREKEATEILSPEVVLPAIGQGAIGIETRADDGAIRSIVERLNHPASFQAVTAERAFLKALGGSCQTPIAGWAEVNGQKLSLVGVVVAPAGDPYLQGVEEGSIREAEAVGQRLAAKLLARGADKLLAL